ncbi:hypothetical protein D082_31720 [Synechocystis sp. PCC 6714]|nr:hypothetical protein D082_31720 [Synechocystis sp. PCC 6714]
MFKEFLHRAVSQKSDGLSSGWLTFSHKNQPHLSPAKKGNAL